MSEPTEVDRRRLLEASIRRVNNALACSTRTKPSRWFIAVRTGDDDTTGIDGTGPFPDKESAESWMRQVHGENGYAIPLTPFMMPNHPRTAYRNLES